MLGVVDLPTYLVGALVVILLPGPNSLFVLATASRSGVRRGYCAAAGVWTGDTILMLLAVGGVASLLQSNAVLFSIVKYVGAGYLTWLGIALVRGAWAAWRRYRGRVGEQMVADVGIVAEAPESSPWGAYRRALTVSLLNPKAILFFVSFFVQFVDPSYPHPWASFLLLGGVVQVASVLYMSALIFSGHRLAEAFRKRERLTAGMTATAGAVFIAFAVKLGLTSVG